MTIGKKMYQRKTRHTIHLCEPESIAATERGSGFYTFFSRLATATRLRYGPSARSAIDKAARSWKHPRSLDASRSGRAQELGFKEESNERIRDEHRAEGSNRLAAL